MSVQMGSGDHIGVATLGGALGHVWAGIVGIMCALVTPPVGVAAAVALHRLAWSWDGLVPLVIAGLCALGLAYVLAWGLCVALDRRGTGWWIVGFGIGLSMSLAGLGLVI